MHVRDQERRIAADKANPHTTSSSGSGDGGGNFTVPSREMSTQTSGGADTEAMLANVSRDGSPAYVSLG